jgi:hypothetical protein
LSDIILNIDTNTEWSEGTLTDVEAVDDSLQLDSDVDYVNTGSRISPPIDLSGMGVVDSSVISWNEINKYSTTQEITNDNNQWEYIFETDVYFKAGTYAFTCEGYDVDHVDEIFLRLESGSNTVDSYLTNVGDKTWTSQSETITLPADGYYDIKVRHHNSASYSYGMRNLKINPNVSVNIETSVDGGSTWQTTTNGGSIADIQGADTLDVRQTLSTTDTTVTPVLDSLNIIIEEGEGYYITGTVEEDGVFVERTVRLYKRSTGELVDEGISDSVDGGFSLITPDQTEHYVVALDDISDATDYNALIYDRVIPVAG